MANQNRVDPLQVPLRMSTTPTVDRQTPKNDFGEYVRAGINSAAGLVVNTATALGALGGGAPIVSAAISQVANMAGFAPGGGGTASFGGYNPGIGSAGSAFGTALQIGPGLVQSAVAANSGPVNAGLMGPGSMSSSGLVNVPSTTATAVTPGGSIAAPLTPTLGGTGSAGGYQTYFSSLGQEQYRMLNLQIAMQQEHQYFVTLSNVLKTRHDTVKAAISNIR